MPEIRHFSNRRFVSRFKDDESCRDYLVRMLWNGKPRCPHCGNKKNIYTYTTRPVYKCGNPECYKQFRVTTGTIFEDSKISLVLWFDAIRLMVVTKKGISSIELAKELGVTQKSAWYMLQNIRLAMSNKKASKMLGGIVEVDETYIGGKKKGGKRGRGTTKTKVFGMLERNGDIRMMRVDDVSSHTLHPIIFDNVEIGSLIMSDEWKAYNNLDGFYARGVINHGKRHYADGDIHVNTLEAAWGLLKRALKGIYHRPSEKYMNNYCSEFEFRYNNRKKQFHIQFKDLIKQSKIRIKHSDLTN